jgi:serine/threonine protein kinase
LAGELFQGLFRKINDLGSGGFGAVYKMQAVSNAPNFIPFLAQAVALRKARRAFPEDSQQLDSINQELDKLVALEWQLFDQGKGAELRRVDRQIKELKTQVIQVSRSRAVKQAHYVKKERSQLSQYGADALIGELDREGIVLPPDLVFAVKAVLPRKAGVSEEDYKDALHRFSIEWHEVINLEHHPNIVHAIAGGPTWYAMDYVEGKKTEEVIAEYTIGQKGRIILGAANGLGHAHSHGLIHRDIKPDNLLVYGDSNVVIVDWGLAKNTQGGLGLTQSGMAMGTPYYMAPEQFDSAKTVDERSDIYSLGAAAYHFFTGKRPVDGKDLFEIFAKVTGQEIEKPSSFIPNFSPDLEAILMPMLAKDASERPQSMIEVADNFKRYLGIESAETLNTFSFYELREKSNARMTIRNRRISERFRKREKKIPLVYKVAGAILGAGLAGILVAVALVGGKTNNNKPVSLPAVVIDYNNEYAKFLPSALAAERELNEFLSGSSIDMRRLDELEVKLKEAYDTVKDYEGKRVLPAKQVSDRLFGLFSKIALRKNSIIKMQEEYNSFLSSVKKLDAEVDSYLGSGDFKLDKLGEYSSAVSSAKRKALEFNAKGFQFDVSKFDSSLQRISGLEDFLRKQAVTEPVVEPVAVEPVKPAVDNTSEVYSAFAASILDLGHAAEEYVNSNSFDMEKLSFLSSRLEKAAEEAKKYQGMGIKEADAVLEEIGKHEKSLGEVKEFVERNRRLIEYFSGLDGSISEAGYNTRDLQRILGEIKTKKLSVTQAASKEGEKGKALFELSANYQKRVEDQLTAMQQSSLIITFDDGTVVYNQRDRNWYVLDLSPRQNHGRIHGRFAFDRRTMKPIVFPTYEAGVQAGYEIFLVDRSRETGRKGDYAGGFNGGYVEVADNDSLDFQRELDISLYIMVEKFPKDCTKLIGKYIQGQRGYLLELGLHNNAVNDFLAFYVSETINPFTGQITRGNIRLSSSHWYSIQCTFQSKSQVIKINGKTDIKDTHNQIARSIATNNSPLIIGYSLSENDYFYGEMDKISLIGK